MSFMTVLSLFLVLGVVLVDIFALAPGFQFIASIARLTNLGNVQRIHSLFVVREWFDCIDVVSAHIQKVQLTEESRADNKALLCRNPLGDALDYAVFAHDLRFVTFLLSRIVGFLLSLLVWRRSFLRAGYRSGWGVFRDFRDLFC